ncbi:MAG TPA: hypothetical protein VEJ63_03215 [Planctomycetota bacterium]|nr:hypothetical protein [Planctomycetota bacterium]
MSSANIQSPEILKEFKIALQKFGETCKQAISGINSDTQMTLQWLRHDQKAYWKRALIKADQEIERARSDYINARFGPEAYKKNSYIDELKILRRCEKRKEDVLKKIDNLKRWTSLLEQQSQKLLGPVHQLSSMIDIKLPNGVAELERMTIALEEYLRTRVPPS